MLDLITSTVRKLSLVTVAFSVSTSAQEWGDKQLGTVSLAADWMESHPQPRGFSQACQSQCHPVQGLVHVQSLLQSTCSPLPEILQKTDCHLILKSTMGRYFPLKDSEAELVGSKRQPRNTESIKWHYKNCCLDPTIHLQQ